MEPGTAKMLVLRRFVSFAFGRTARPAEGLVRGEAGCAGRYLVCRAARVGARACSGGGDLSRHLPPFRRRYSLITASYKNSKHDTVDTHTVFTARRRRARTAVTGV